MSLKPLKVVLFLGSARVGRMGSRVAAFMSKHLKERGYEVDVFDPMELKLPILEQPIHFYQDQSKVPDLLRKLDGRIETADAYVIVSPEYNNCIPPALSNVMNHFPPKHYAFKPSLIVTYSAGRYGGAVVGSQLRTFTGILGCPSIPSIFSVAEVHKALDESGKPLQDHLDERVRKTLNQFDWMATAFKEKKLKDGAPEY